MVQIEAEVSIHSEDERIVTVQLKHVFELEMYIQGSAAIEIIEENNKFNISINTTVRFDTSVGSFVKKEKQDGNRLRPYYLQYKGHVYEIEGPDKPLLLIIGSGNVVVDFAYDREEIQHPRLRAIDNVFYFPDTLFKLSSGKPRGVEEGNKLHAQNVYGDSTFSHASFHDAPVSARVPLIHAIAGSEMNRIWGPSFPSLQPKRIDLLDALAGSGFSVTLLSYDNEADLPSKASVITTITGEFASDIPAQPDPTRVGYHFIGWFDDVEASVPVALPAKMPAAKLILWAKWSPNTDTPYLVESYVENWIRGSYTLHTAKWHEGTTDAAVEYEPVPIPGFITPPQQTSWIHADGTTVVQYYYSDDGSGFPGFPGFPGGSSDG